MFLPITSPVDETSLDELRAELAGLEAAERQISAERRRLHHQIDYGFANAETHAREREVSAERRRLHQRIDSLRELLPAGAEKNPTDLQPLLNRLSHWPGISPEVVATDEVYDEELEL
jgi:hypothetical protein